MTHRFLRHRTSDLYSVEAQRTLLEVVNDARRNYPFTCIPDKFTDRRQYFMTLIQNIKAEVAADFAKVSSTWKSTRNRVNLQIHSAAVPTSLPHDAWDPEDGPWYEVKAKPECRTTEKDFDLKKHILKFGSSLCLVTNVSMEDEPGDTSGVHVQCLTLSAPAAEGWEDILGSFFAGDYWLVLWCCISLLAGGALEVETGFLEPAIQEPMRRLGFDLPSTEGAEVLQGSGDQEDVLRGLKRRVEIVTGNPGSGKGHLALMILSKLLETETECGFVACVTNGAVDAMVDKLHSWDLAGHLLVVGRPKPNTTAWYYTLESQLERHPDLVEWKERIVSRIELFQDHLGHALRKRVEPLIQERYREPWRLQDRKEYTKVAQSILRLRTGRFRHEFLDEFRVAFDDLDHACDELGQLVGRIRRSILANIRVVASTLSSTHKVFQLRKDYPGLVLQDLGVAIVNEAGQAPEKYNPVLIKLGARQIVFLGHELQIKPRVECADKDRQKITQFKLDRSFMERALQGGFKPQTLHTQHRMCDSLDHLARDIIGRNYTDESYSRSSEDAIQWWQVDGQEKAYFERGDKNPSKYNMEEALVVHQLLEELSGSVLVVAFHKPQVYLLKHLVYLKHRKGGSADVIVTTADAAQGSEADHVVISTVRTADQCNLAFMDQRRLLAAVTRAEESLTIVGNYDTFERNATKDWRVVLGHVQKFDEPEYPLDRSLKEHLMEIGDWSVEPEQYWRRARSSGWAARPQL